MLSELKIRFQSNEVLEHVNNWDPDKICHRVEFGLKITQHFSTRTTLVPRHVGPGGAVGPELMSGSP